MFEALSSFRVDTPGVLIGALALTVVLVVAVAWHPRDRSRRWWLVTGLVTAAAGILGVAAVWVFGDLLDVFDFTFTRVFRLWVGFAFAGLAFAVACFVGTRVWQKFAAGLLVVSVLATAVVYINADFGEYRTIADFFGPRPVTALTLPPQSSGLDVATRGFAAAWTPPATMPDTGSIGTVTIPATVSHFAARPAVVYLPPAARTVDPPKLPVMVMLSGQPGQPDDLFSKGDLAHVLDDYAADHKGLAPIVVIPDQLSDPNKNPMCVDSPLGNSATYITQDVTTWITQNLPVTTDHRYWGVGGFSQGATCTTQFGAAHPDLYRTWFDIAGEEAPTIGAGTVAEGFGGSVAAYEAAKPATILRRNAPYKDVAAIVGWGSLDTRLGPETAALEKAMNAAGVSTTRIVSPGTAHDWNTVKYVFEHGIPPLAARLGLETR